MFGTKAYSEKWGIKQSIVARLCREGKIKGAEQDSPGKPWRIPEDAKPPEKYLK